MSPKKSILKLVSILAYTFLWNVFGIIVAKGDLVDRVTTICDPYTVEKLVRVGYNRLKEFQRIRIDDCNRWKKSIKLIDQTCYFMEDPYYLQYSQLLAIKNITLDAYKQIILWQETAKDPDFSRAQIVENKFLSASNKLKLCIPPDYKNEEVSSSLKTTLKIWEQYHGIMMNLGRTTCLPRDLKTWEKIKEQADEGVDRLLTKLLDEEPERSSWRVKCIFLGVGLFLLVNLC